MFITKLRADSGDRSPAGDFWFSPVAARTSAGVRVTSQSALALPAVWACGRVLAESFAVLPFMLYQPKPEGRGRTRVTRHWLERLMCRKPNRFQSPYEWRLMLQWHLALRGNAFCQITDDGRGGIDELLPLHPDRMAAEMLDSGNYRYRYTDEAGRAHYYTRGQIWHLRGVSNDGIVGLNPIEAEREAIGEAMAMQTYASRFYANDAKPGGGWIEHPGGFSSPAAKKVFRESWQEMQGGSNRGKVAVLERGMKFHELGLNNADAQFVEGRGLKVADICRIFRVPPHKIQDLQRSTNNNIEHQGIEFWNDTMRPYSSLWASSINCFLLGEDSDLQPTFDMSEVLMGDSQSRSRYWSTMTTAGILTRNEGREAENYDPLDGLDEPLQPMNMGNAGANAVQPQDRGQSQNDARTVSMLRANAGRMARRLVAGKPLKPEALAEALAIQEYDAAVWLSEHDCSAMGEPAVTESLLHLALKEPA